MSVFAPFTNIFKDAFRLIEANLTPFEINNLRITMKHPLLDLNLCTTDQIVRGIEDGVDFQVLPIYLRGMEQKDFNIFDFVYRCGHAISRRGDSTGYKWLCRIQSLYPGFTASFALQECLLNNKNVPEVNYALSTQVLVTFLEAELSIYNIKGVLESLRKIEEFAKTRGDQATCNHIRFLRNAVYDQGLNY